MNPAKSCTRSRGFKLAITSEIIGKLGGADVEEHPIGLEDVDGNGVRRPLFSVATSGRALVAVEVENIAGPSNSSNQPQFYAGDIMGPRMARGEAWWLAVVDTDVEFGLQTNVNPTSGSKFTFSGTAYVAQLE